MTEKLDLFRFEEKEVRTHIDEKGDPWFVAKDVCEILEIGNSSDAIGRLEADEKGVAKSDTLGGSQAMAIISESGVYALVIRSNKPNAKKFRKWITSEVIPSIRKTGSYSVKKLSPAEMMVQQAQMLLAHEREIEALKAANEALREADEALFGKQEEQSILLADMQDGADFYAITAYHKVFLKKPISNEDAKKDGFRLAKICKAHGIQLGRSPHPIWGTVNTYPKAILDEYYVRGGNLSEN